MPRSIDDRLKSLLRRDPVIPKKKLRKKKRRRKKTDIIIDPTALHECSESELVAITHELGFEDTSRAMTRDDLIEVILGQSDEEPGVDILGSVRSKIYAYVKGNRSMISAAEMRCDLHCPTCPHHRVVECYTVNQDLVE